MRPSRVLALILVVLVFPATVFAQQTIYACAKNTNGQLRFVAAGEKCLPSEHLVTWQASGAAIPPPSTPAPTPGPLKVVDAGNATVGVFVGNVAARQAGDVWVALPVSDAGFVMNKPADYFAYYVTSNCSGDQYQYVDKNNLLRAGLFLDNGGLKFFYPTKNEVDGSQILSLGFYADGIWSCYGPLPQSPVGVYGKVAYIDVSSFAAPFKIVQ